MSSFITATELAKRMKVQPNGLLRMAKEGTIPQPTDTMGRTPYWDLDELKDWFEHLHPEQSAYVPAKGIGTNEFHKFQAYICPVVQGDPDTSSWISSRRPSAIALRLEGYSKIQVYEVDWAETQEGIMGESLIKYPNDRSNHKAPWTEITKMRPNNTLPLIYFKLGKFVGEFDLDATIYRGGTVSTESLIQAIQNGRAKKFKNGEAIL